MLGRIQSRLENNRRFSERRCVYIASGRMIRELASLWERRGVFEAQERLVLGPRSGVLRKMNT